MNKSIVLGRVTWMGDVEEKGSSSMPVLNFYLAHNEKRGGEQKSTKFNCVAFNKTAETIKEYVSVGQQFLVEGQMKCDQWDDKETGAKREKWNLIVNQFSFVGNKSEAEDDDNPFAN